jgi:hypothetical protein
MLSSLLKLPIELTSLVLRTLSAVVGVTLALTFAFGGYILVCAGAAWLLHLVVGWVAAGLVVGSIALVVGGFFYFLYKMLANVDNIDYDRKRSR